jgi:AraC-like DNA-binding protein
MYDSFSWAGRTPGPVPVAERPPHGAVVDTADYPEADRERMFVHVHALSGLVEVLERPVHCRLEIHELGDIRVQITRASARRTARLAQTIAIDRRDAVRVMLLTRGAIRGSVDGCPVTVGAGEALVVDLARPVWLEHTEDEIIAIDLERRLVARQLPWLTALNGCIVGGPAACPLADHLAAFAARLRHLAPGEAHAEGRRMTAVLAAALPRPSQAPLSQRVLADDLRVFERAARYIDANFASVELEPSQIWKAANVSRSRLYRVFASVGGISKYIAQQRLAEAYAALILPDEHRTIASIAHDAGFANVSHFARAFRAAFGQTAGEVRRARAGRSSGS